MVKSSTLLIGCLCVSNTLAFAPPTSIISTPTATTTTSSSLHASSDEAQYDCLVIGGGISGSTLAHNLHKSNLNILLAEQRDYLGGNVQSVVHTDEDGNEFIFEKGTNSYATQPSIIRISHELGIDDKLVFANE